MSSSLFQWMMTVLCGEAGLTREKSSRLPCSLVSNDHDSSPDSLFFLSLRTTSSVVWGGRINLTDILKVPWHVAIYDEAHKLKNRSSKTYEASCQLPTKLRYGLTGTAMQVISSMYSFPPVKSQLFCSFPSLSSGLQAGWLDDVLADCGDACRISNSCAAAHLCRANCY